MAKVKSKISLKVLLPLSTLAAAGICTSTILIVQNYNRYKNDNHKTFLSWNEIKDFFWIDGSSLNQFTSDGDIGLSQLIKQKNATGITFGNDIEEIQMYAFYSCGSLNGENKVDIRFLNQNIWIHEYAFANCKSLGKIIGKNFDVYEGGFYNCTNLTLPLSKKEKITILYSAFDAFYGCENLTVEMLANLEFGGDWYELKYFNNGLGAAVVYGGDYASDYTSPALTGCLIAGDIGDEWQSLIYYGEEDDNTIVPDSCFAGSASLSGIDLSPATWVGYGAFYECTNLKSIVQKQGDGFFADESAFYQCKNLILPTAEDGYTLKLNGHGGDYFYGTGWYTFEGCQKLTVDMIKNIDLTEISDYRKLVLTDDEMSGAAITFTNPTGWLGDAGCLVAGDWGTEWTNILSGGRLEADGWSFSGCASLRSIDITNWEEGEIYECTFQGCVGLEEIRINANTEVIDSWAFAGCENLKLIDKSEGDFAPISVDEYGYPSIGESAFDGCSNIGTWVGATIDNAVIDLGIIRGWNTLWLTNWVAKSNLV